MANCGSAHNVVLCYCGSWTPDALEYPGFPSVIKWVYIPRSAAVVPLQFCIPVVRCQAQQSRWKAFPAREGCCTAVASCFPSCLFACLQSHGKPVAFPHSLSFTSLDRVYHVSICLNVATKCIPSAFSLYAPTDFPCIYSEQWSSIWSVGR